MGLKEYRYPVLNDGEITAVKDEEKAAGKLLLKFTVQTKEEGNLP